MVQETQSSDPPVQGSKKPKKDLNLVKRGGTWSVVIELERSPETGQRQKYWRSGFTHAEAVDHRDQVRARLGRDAGARRKSRNFTVDEWMNEWIGQQRLRLRESTLSSYEGHMRKHISPAIGKKKLSKLQPTDVRRMVQELHAGGLSPSTCRRVVATLHVSLAQAVADGEIWTNPADRATRGLPTPKKDQLSVWSFEQLKAFLAHMREDRLYAAFYLAGYTGARRGEVLGLTWSKIDLDAGEIVIDRTLVAIRHKLAWSTPKTSRGNRRVSLDADTVEVLKAHKVAQNLARLEREEEYFDEDLVFAQEDGSPVHPDWFSKRFDQEVTAAGLPRIRLHDVRHTSASMMIAKGVPVPVVAERLGHSDPSFTYRVYSHALPGAQREAAEIFAQAMRDAK